MEGWIIKMFFCTFVRSLVTGQAACAHCSAVLATRVSTRAKLSAASAPLSAALGQESPRSASLRAEGERSISKLGVFGKNSGCNTGQLPGRIMGSPDR